MLRPGSGEDVHGITGRQDQVAHHPRKFMLRQDCERLLNGRHIRDAIASAHLSASDEGHHLWVIIDNEDMR